MIWLVGYELNSSEWNQPLNICSEPLIPGSTFSFFFSFGINKFGKVISAVRANGVFLSSHCGDYLLV